MRKLLRKTNRLFGKYKTLADDKNQNIESFKNALDQYKEKPAKSTIIVQGSLNVDTFTA